MELFVEIADSPETREIGLMERKHLAENKGMLFKFQNPHHLSFWMKKTYIPLDIAFLNDDGKILQISEMIPMNLRAVRSNVPCKYALEVNKGWFNKNQLNVGSQIDIKYIKDASIGRMSYAQNASMEPIDENELDQEIPFMDDEVDMIPEDAFENEFGQFNPMEEEGIEVSPNVELLRSYRNILKYAEDEGKTLMVTYYTLSGRIWGPRHIGPLEGEYILKTGPNGESVTCTDLSPSFSGANWSITGGKPKRLILDNIVQMEIVE